MGILLRFKKVISQIVIVLHRHLLEFDCQGFNIARR